MFKYIKKSNANYPKMASNAIIDARTSESRTIVPKNLDYAVRSVLPLTSNTLPATLVANTEYYLSEVSEISISLPATGKLGQYCFIKFDSGSTAAVFNITSNNFVGDIPTPAADTTYEFIATWNGSKWACNYRGY